MAETDVVPAAQKSSWGAFLKQLTSLSGDLSSMTAPPFILSPVSLTEYPSYWCERPDLFAAIADGKTPEDRAMKVLRWFISTLKGQYTSRNEKMGSEKKPLNPVLGELFFGTWADHHGRGETKLTVEQVSHHPPITAYHIDNASKGVTLLGHCAQKTSFSTGAIIVKQVGHAILTVNIAGASAPEEYLITLPNLRIDGIFYGSPYIELTNTSWIASSTGWVSTIEYKGKGYFGGKSHSFKAILTPPGSTTPKRTVEGQWHETSKINGGAQFTDVRGPKEEVEVKDLEEQGEWETRKLWQHVSKGIRSGDFETASREKTKIENEQRQRRKDEIAAGVPWKLKYFEHIDEDPTYTKLARLCNGNPPLEDAYIFRSPPA
ncbi:Oxysterol binding protein [Tulasnella sp. JGI-2019a]|nr:Oxysterol binding protein [Tulasnella sp. JGI-2019a]KAG9028573.1 Oxysterol binding protein [Tulasnella sp. JGI-2019a]